MVDVGGVERSMEDKWREETQEAWEFYRKGEGHTFGHKEAVEIGYIAARTKAQVEIDELNHKYDDLWSKSCDKNYWINQNYELRKDIEELKRAENKILSHYKKDIKDRDQEIEKLKEWKINASNELKMAREEIRVLNDLCVDLNEGIEELRKKLKIVGDR